MYFMYLACGWGRSAIAGGGVYIYIYMSIVGMDEDRVKK